MSTILDQILLETRERIRQSKRRLPVSALEARPAFRGPIRPLGSRLRKAPAPAIIAECKRASPSEGPICERFDPAAISRSYERHGAAAISVLTEPNHFQGTLEDLAAVRTAVNVPILRKDFIVDPYQLVEARAFGADAVLLIAAALEPSLLADLHHDARSLGLEVIVEVHAEEELDHLDLDAIGIFGVNHRDLKTLTIDLTASARIFGLLPPRVLRVAESGISTPGELARLVADGADAFLVGTSLMMSPDPGVALETLRRDAATAIAEKQRVAP